jgi:homoserine O-acetyltransferase
MMNTHDVGRGRGGVEAALAGITARTLVAGISSDRLYPPEEQHRLAAGIPGSGPARIIESPYGHDGFLIEAGAVGDLVAELLAS